MLMLMMIRMIIMVTMTSPPKKLISKKKFGELLKSFAVDDLDSQSSLSFQHLDLPN